jgi:hypothetical protein
MWSWVVIALLYCIGIGMFQVLGGFASAAQGIQRWGRWSGERQRARIERQLEQRRR